MKKIFHLLLDWAKKFFTSLDKTAQEFLDEAVTYAGYVKNILDNPIVGEIVRLTPTTVDDSVEEKLRGYLDKIMPQLINIQGFEGMSLKDKIDTFIGFVNSALGEKGKNGIILNIASAILQLLVKDHTGKDLPNKAADTQVQARTYMLFPPAEVK